MVSNRLSSISRIRCGNSIVTTPVGLSSTRMPPTKSLMSGTCASTLLPTIRSAWPLGARRCASSTPKNSVTVGMPLAIAASATLAAGSMPRTPTPSSSEILQQIAVVAGQLDHEAVLAEPQPAAHDLAVRLGVGEHRVGEGREIGVVVEDFPRADVLFELDQEALLADADVQRIERLHLVQLVPGGHGAGTRATSRDRRRYGATARGRTGRAAPPPRASTASRTTPSPELARASEPGASEHRPAGAERTPATPRAGCLPAPRAAPGRQCAYPGDHCRNLRDKDVAVPHFRCGGGVEIGTRGSQQLGVCSVCPDDIGRGRWGAIGPSS